MSSRHTNSFSISTYDLFWSYHTCVSSYCCHIFDRYMDPTGNKCSHFRGQSTGQGLHNYVFLFMRFLRFQNKINQSIKP